MRRAPDPRPQPLAPRALLGETHRRATLCWVDADCHHLDPALRTWLEHQLWTRPPLAVAQQLDQLDEWLAHAAPVLSDTWGATLARLAKLLRIVQQHPEWFGLWSWRGR